jgi:exodeoxyribonuclease VII large subunit
VQGELASGQIAGAIGKFNELNNVDVIILARGGGSLEELWAFNTEVVARSISNSEIPIISAVGHETDFTISDFAADLRAPTPSAAAELVMPEKIILCSKIDSLKVRMNHSVRRLHGIRLARLDKVKNSMIFKQPYDKIYQERLHLDVLNKYMHRGLAINQERVHAKMGLLTARLDTLSPLKILSRGYSISRNSQNGAVIKSITNVQTGDDIQISLNDGTIDCKVKDIKGF